MNYNFLYTIGEDTDEPIMLINNSIGEQNDNSDYIDGALFQKELMYLDSLNKKITIHINSAGGSVIDGMSIFDSIITAKNEITCINSGICASIAAVILLAGKKVKFLDYATIMIHNPYSTDKESDNAKEINILRNQIIKMISQRCHKNEDEVGEMMNDTTWINAQEALKYGMCDDIINTNKELNTPTDIQMKWQYANVYLNKLIKNKKENMIDKLNEVLNSFEDKASLLSHLTNFIKNEIATNTKNENGDMEDDDSTDYKTMYEELKQKFEEMCNKIESDKIVEKCADIVNSAIKCGKIAKEAEATWINMFKNNFELAEKAISSLSVNKTLPKIEISDKPSDSIFNINNHMNLSLTENMNLKKTLEIKNKK